ncbi:hypothetical protein Fmac_028093 [Flemingia macrophylla]|uniref:Uncharacterized protein n=1 Tax=Flemingia macrophylla TaxID=520843 RepID=A0ABD1LJL0_9FABA
MTPPPQPDSPVASHPLPVSRLPATPPATALPLPHHRLLASIYPIPDPNHLSFPFVLPSPLNLHGRFLITLLRHRSGGEGDGKSLADDIAVDDEGNAYVIDALGNKIWKVSVEGKLVSTIRDSMLSPKKWWYKHFVGLNGIVDHPDGFLIAVHTLSGDLFKIEGEESVKIIKVTGGTGNPPGKFDYADGLALLSPTKVVVVGNPPARLVESNDGWNTASVVGTFSGLKHRFATGATVKDGKVYLNYMIGMGYPKRKHAIVEAVF